LPAWKLTIRHGPDVTRQGFDRLDPALDAASEAVDKILAEGPLERVRAIRDYEPDEIVGARIEISGKGLLRPPTAGLDIQGDGTLIGFSGGISRKQFDSGNKSAIFHQIREVLDTDRGGKR
jgi:hypothetical protein